MKQIFLAIMLSAGVIFNAHAFIGEGTWVVSYKVNNKTHTDSIILDNFDFSGKTTGLYFADQKGRGTYIECALANLIDYICSSNGKGFLLQLDENTIKDGAYASGSTDDIALSLLFKDIPLTGFRVISASYHDDSRELLIPSVGFQGQYYRAILKLENDATFSIAFAELTEDLSNISYVNDKLILSSVLYNGEDYNVVLKMQRNGRFAIKDIQLN